MNDFVGPFLLRRRIGIGVRVGVGVGDGVVPVRGRLVRLLVLRRCRGGGGRRGGGSVSLLFLTSLLGVQSHLGWSQSGELVKAKDFREHAACVVVVGLWGCGVVLAKGVRVASGRVACGCRPPVSQFSRPSSVVSP